MSVGLPTSIMHHADSNDGSELIPRATQRSISINSSNSTSSNAVRAGYQLIG